MRGNVEADLNAAWRCGGLWFQPQHVQYQLPEWAPPTLIQEEPRQQSHNCRGLKARIKPLAPFENPRQRFPWFFPEVIEHSGLVYAGDSTKRSTVFGSGALAHKIFKRIILERNPGPASLLRTVMHKALFADVEETSSCATVPIVGEATADIFLEAVEMCKGE
jgi:hypothetical protein